MVLGPLLTPYFLAHLHIGDILIDNFFLDTEEGKYLSYLGMEEHHSEGTKAGLSIVVRETPHYTDRYNLTYPTVAGRAEETIPKGVSTLIASETPGSQKSPASCLKRNQLFMYTLNLF